MKVFDKKITECIYASFILLISHYDIFSVIFSVVGIYIIALEILLREKKWHSSFG